MNDSIALYGEPKKLAAHIEKLKAENLLLKETYHKKLSAYRRFAAIMICKNGDHQYTLDDCLDEKNEVFK